MPYYKHADFFYIHIPKTGGTSIGHYFTDKTDTEEYRLYGFFLDNAKTVRLPNERSAQHLTYSEILQNMDILDVIFAKHCNENHISGMEVVRLLNFKHAVVSVRNPYDRIISELFWKDWIRPYSTKEEIEHQIYIYLNSDCINNYDNHRTPQYKFIIDESGNILQNIHIIKTETLTRDMHRLGYTDFDKFENKYWEPVDVDYKMLLTENAKQIIYEYYNNDFTIFGYSK